MTAPSDGDSCDDYLANRAVPHMSQSPFSTPIRGSGSMPIDNWRLRLRETSTERVPTTRSTEDNTATAADKCGRGHQQIATTGSSCCALASAEEG